MEILVAQVSRLLGFQEPLGLTIGIKPMRPLSVDRAAFLGEHARRFDL